MGIMERWAPSLLITAAATGIVGTFLPMRAMRGDVREQPQWGIEWSFWEISATPEDESFWGPFGLELVDPSATATGGLLVVALLVVAASGGALAASRRRPSWAGRARTAVMTAVAVLVGVVASFLVVSVAETRPPEEADGMVLQAVTAGPAVVVVAVAAALAVAGALAARPPRPEPDITELATPPMGIRRID